MPYVNLNEQVNTIPDNADQIYYNLKIDAPNTGENDAIYSENRVQPILERPSDYELAIVRFSVPTTQIPMFFFIENQWSLTLRYNNIDYLEYLQFVPNSASNPVDTIYVPQEFVDSINNAFTASFLALKTANPGILSTVAPEMTYDPVTDLITLNVQQNYLTDGIDIFFNNPLNILIFSFQTFYNASPPSQQVYRIIVADRGGLNTGTLGGQPSYLMKQEFPTTFTWSIATKLRFETNSIPVVRELDGGQKNITSALLTDFNFPSGERYTRDPLIFFPQGPLRWQSLNSDYPLNKIDLQVYWVDKDDKKYLLKIIGTEYCSVKIVFRKKPSLRLKEYIEDEIDNTLEELKL